MCYDKSPYVLSRSAPAPGLLVRGRAEGGREDPDRAREGRGGEQTAILHVSSSTPHIDIAIFLWRRPSVRIINIPGRLLDICLMLG